MNPFTMLHINIIVGIIAGSFYDYEVSRNIVLFTLWAMSVATFIALFAKWPPRKSRPIDHLNNVLVLFEIVLLAASGWFVIATVYSVAAAMVTAKKLDSTANIGESE